MTVSLLSLFFWPQNLEAEDVEGFDLFSLSRVSGVDVAEAVSGRSFTQSLASDIQTVSQSTLPALNKFDLQVKKEDQWNLRSVGVGLGLNTSIGLGPIYSIGVNARSRLVFSNMLNPVYP